MMELKLTIQLSEDKLEQIVQDAVKALKDAGYIWKDNPDAPLVLDCGGVNE